MTIRVRFQFSSFQLAFLVKTQSVGILDQEEKEWYTPYSNPFCWSSELRAGSLPDPLPTLKPIPRGKVVMGRKILQNFPQKTYQGKRTAFWKLLVSDHVWCFTKIFILVPLFSRADFFFLTSDLRTFLCLPSSPTTILYSSVISRNVGFSLQNTKSKK